MFIDDCYFICFTLLACRVFLRYNIVCFQTIVLPVRFPPFHLLIFASVKFRIQQKFPIYYHYPHRFNSYLFFHNFSTNNHNISFLNDRQLKMTDSGQRQDKGHF